MKFIPAKKKTLIFIVYNYLEVTLNSLINFSDSGEKNAARFLKTPKHQPGSILGNVNRYWEIFIIQESILPNQWNLFGIILKIQEIGTARSDCKWWICKWNLLPSKNLKLQSILIHKYIWDLRSSFNRLQKFDLHRSYSIDRQFNFGVPKKI